MKKVLKRFVLSAICLLPLQMVLALGNNEILYTTANGEKIELNGEIAIGATIVSNTYENGQGVISFDSEVTNIQRNAFRGMKQLTSIEMPGSITIINDYAFYNCTALDSINIPEGVVSLGESVFDGCKNLNSVSIPNTVTYIGSALFAGCENLSNVNIPSGVTSVGEFTFYGCSTLTSVSIPNVSNIGNAAFEGCIGLIKVETIDTDGNVKCLTFDK